MRIYAWKSPRFINPIFRWIFWRQLRGNYGCGRRGCKDRYCKGGCGYKY